MKILVVGGAGYIGSHMVKMLSRQGHAVLTFDNLSTGYLDAVQYGQFLEGDISDTAKLKQLFGDNQFDCVMHFASFIEVGESVSNPSKYYSNNFAKTLNLLDAMIEHNVKNFIFSSTAAIFGEPEYTPIDEKHRLSPVNPYGDSKMMVEMALKAYDQAYGLKSVCLRYFNAAGADPDGELGERHDPETHLVPLILQVASGRRESISLFGNDYDTADGSCVRDYIHINDLCDAHVRAMMLLQAHPVSSQFNLGNGQGFSVLEVIAAVEKVTGRSITVVPAKRRAGDPAVLVADSTLAREVLEWKPAYDNLETIIEHAWRWEQKHWH